MHEVHCLLPDFEFLAIGGRARRIQCLFNAFDLLSAIAYATTVAYIEQSIP